MGHGADLPMGSASTTSAPDPQTDAASQRCRGMAEDADERMATLRATDALSD